MWHFSNLARGGHLGELSRASILEWLAEYRGVISEIALKDRALPQDYACTFCAAIMWEENSVFAQIGDGAIVLAQGIDKEPYHVVFWPQHGEYANSTNFVTQANAEDTLCFDRRQEPIAAIALFTDGIERLKLDFSSMTAHGPALRPIFQWLRSTESSVDECCAVVARYLTSHQIQSRTDDDTTLLMAARR